MNYYISDFLLNFYFQNNSSEWNIFLSDSANIEITINNNQLYEKYYDLTCINPRFRDHIISHNNAILFASSDWTNSQIYGVEACDVDALALTQLISYAANKSTLLIHSSLVSYNGSGVLFTGPSGIGKTTQAELWYKYLGADILNGDMVIVRRRDDIDYGYGSPWHGSSPYFMNAKVPLKAIIVLKQTPENHFFRLSADDIIAALMPQILIPHWDENRAESALDYAETLLNAVPVYCLQCRPDEEAVMLVKDSLGI